jgi:hypothetical protein
MSETEGAGAARRPWLWIGLSAVLLAGVVALAIWAVGLRQDLDDSNAEVERYQAQSAQVATESDDLSAQIDQLAAAIDDTSGRLDEAIAAGQQSADELRGKAADANQGTDELRQKAADAQADAQGAVEALDTRMSDLADQIKAKLAELKAAAADPGTADAPDPEPEPTTTPEAPVQESATEKPPKDGDAAEEEKSPDPE